MTADVAVAVRRVTGYAKVEGRTIYRLVDNGRHAGLQGRRFGKIEVERWTRPNAAGPGEESIPMTGER